LHKNWDARESERFRFQSGTFVPHSRTLSRVRDAADQPTGLGVRARQRRFCLCAATQAWCILAGMKLSALWLAPGLLPLALGAQIPPAVIPAGVGVNIHFVTGHARDLDLITNAGFKFVRMDFSWQATERKAGVYDWTEYEELTAHLEQRGLRAIYILDYVNELYEPMVEAHRAVGEPAPELHLASPRHPESVAAFARWSAAAARHFQRRHVLWEIYNEPNGGFWRPKPDAAEYTTLALATAKAIREAEPFAIVIAPAMSGFDWKYMEYFLKSGVLEFLDAVSVHPYRSADTPPETAAVDYKKLREMMDRYAPESKRGKIPILSGEWGYASNTKGVSLETQAAYAVRQQLSNLFNGVPLSIWYDWKNDGRDAEDGEQNFGTVQDDLQPKPAYRALKTMTDELNGYRLERRWDGLPESDFVLVFVNSAGRRKAAAWTLAKPHAVRLGGLTPEKSLELGPLPQYVALK
jgi:polysaccharide biosynthesis protein PslG